MDEIVLQLERGHISVRHLPRNSRVTIIDRDVPEGTTRLIFENTDGVEITQYECNWKQMKIRPETIAAGESTIVWAVAVDEQGEEIERRGGDIVFSHDRHQIGPMYRVEADRLQEWLKVYGVENVPIQEFHTDKPTAPCPD